MSDTASAARTDDSNEIVILIERKQVLFEGEEIGSWRYPEGAAARWLLANGKAKRNDRLRTFQDGMFCLRGSVGWFADHTISETDKGGLRVVKWRPMPEGLRSPYGDESGRPFEGSEAE